MKGLMQLQPTNEIVGKQSEYKTTEDFVCAVREEYGREVKVVSECNMRYYPKGTDDSKLEFGAGEGVYMTANRPSKGSFKVWMTWRMEENENFIHNKYGYCFYFIEANDTAIIFNLYVEPEYRQKGHAKKLIQMVIKEIKETGYDKEIQIEAQPREDSINIENLIAFYKRLGLQIL